MVFLGRVSEEVKQRNLRSAEVYVAPNLGGESFGIVLVEAMTAGCAVVASDLRSFRDVAGSAAKLFATGSVPALVDQVTEVLGTLPFPNVCQRLGRSGQLCFPGTRSALPTGTLTNR